MKNIKRLIALVLSCSLLLTGCVQASNVSKNINVSEDIASAVIAWEMPSESTIYENESSLDVVDKIVTDIPEFSSLSDETLLQYIKDQVYSDLENKFNSEDYIIEEIQTVYISKEYLEELSYNSKSNIYFGYTLDEIEEQFDGTSYIFTLGEDGTTKVQPFEDYDDTFEQVIQNVVIGTGVILVCVIVSVVSEGLGIPAVSIIFAESAKKGAECALSRVISDAVSAAVTGYQTKDYDTALKEVALSCSEDFKWGAISGVIDGASKAITLHNAVKVQGAADAIPSFRESELRALKNYGGKKEVAFWEGKEVSITTKGSTRPDIVRIVDGHLEAIEVKNYSLENNNNLGVLCNVLKKEISARVENLPSGSTQRIVLDVKGRGYTEGLILTVKEKIQNELKDIYPNIPIDIMGL